MSGSSSSAHAVLAQRRRRLLAAIAVWVGAPSAYGKASVPVNGPASRPAESAAGGKSSTEAGNGARRAAGAPACDSRVPLPPRFRLDYVAQASRGPLSLQGENELVFATEGTRYTLRSATRSILFNAEQDSAGEVHGALLRPHEYHERSARRPTRTTRIDWQADRVSFSANSEGTTSTRPLLQDRLSLLVSAGQQLRLQQGQGAIELPVAGARQVSLYRFEPGGVESLDLPIGRIEAHRLERPISTEHDGIAVWIAPTLCWLPVQLRFVDDRGQVVQNRLRAAHFD